MDSITIKTNGQHKAIMNLMYALNDIAIECSQDAEFETELEELNIFQMSVFDAKMKLYDQII